MICKSCGYENAEGSVFCANCGASMEAPVAEVVADQPYVETPVVAEKKKAEPMGIIAMILGILGLLGSTFCSCLCGCLGGSPALIMCIAGVVLGIIGLNKSKKQGEKNTMALVGIILSGVGILLFIISALVGGAISTAFLGDTEIFEDLMYELHLY